MKIPYKKTAKSLRGFSTPIFGISWDPPESDREIARKLIIFLEERRVLFYPFEREIPIYLNKSVLEIREYLTKVLQEIDEVSGLNEHLRVMRKACRKYLDEETKQHRGHSRYNDPIPILALGELRGIFGEHLAHISVKYGIDLNQELESILPIEDKEEQ